MPSRSLPLLPPPVPLDAIVFALKTFSADPVTIHRAFLEEK